jgi:hypothetical protein
MAAMPVTAMRTVVTNAPPLQVRTVNAVERIVVLGRKDGTRKQSSSPLG